MKRILLILVLVFIAGSNQLFSQTCLPDGIIFTTQEEIDDFSVNYPGCTEILGSIEIDGLNSNITNLLGLSQIEIINGDLNIFRIPLLESLEGLEFLEMIDGDLYINLCNDLVSLNALQSLTSVSSEIRLSNLSSLQSLSGLEEISGAIEVLNLFGCSQITNLEGLNNINEIDNVLIRGCVSFENFQGLDNVEWLGELAILNCPSVQSFEGLNNLSSIEGDLVMGGHYGAWVYQGSSQINNFSGLENLDTILGDLTIGFNPSLQNLNGLNSLRFVGEDIRIYNNPDLEDITAINLGVYVSDSLRISDNPNLTFCSTPFVCDFITSSDHYQIEDNAEGCNAINDVLLGCFDSLGYTLLEGIVRLDRGEDCTESPGDSPLENWLVSVYGDSTTFTVSTDSNGYYWIPVPTGDWILDVATPSIYFESCFADTLLSTVAMGDSISTDFYIRPLGDCSFIDFDLYLPPLRPCATSTVVLNYCNYGGIPANETLIQISIDSLLAVVDAEPMWTSVDSSGAFIYTFEIDSLDVFDCGQIELFVQVDCEDAEVGDIQCLDVNIISDELCDPDSLWDGSIITASGYCDNDSIFFDLENIGTGNMSEAAQFRVEIIIDDIVLLLDVDDYQLETGEQLGLAYELEGEGMRLEADQTEGHPLYEEASAVVPSCDDEDNNLLITLLPTNDGDPYAETYCRAITGSYDPNIKTAVPVGLGDEHEIDTNWLIDYTVQFQNTGNDTAFLVVVRDTLSENLDLSTLSVRGASHAYTWALNQGRELVFTFENILLPDSTTNEAESQGFFRFSILPKADLLPGTIIENKVGIYFDFNDPIITNTVFHTIRKPVVTSSEHVDWCIGEWYEEQIINQDTSIQILTEFLEYDSVHFVHLDVISTTIEDTLFIDAVIGSYIEEVLISGDTLFTISYENETVCDSLITYFVTGLTSTNNLSDVFQKVTVYPNPTSDILHVSEYQSTEAQEWKLYNKLGEIIWRESINPYELLEKLNMGQYASGVYLLQVNTNEGSSIWKVIKN